MKENLQTAGGDYGNFIRFIPDSDLVSYSQLSTLAGVSSGSLVNQGSGWLLFELGGKQLIVSKKNIRINLSWVNINAAGCVTGTKIVTIKGRQYRVRLLKALDPSLTIGPNITTPGYLDYLVEGTHNSEWSRLFYPIVRDDAHIPITIRNRNALFYGKELGMEVTGNNALPSNVTGVLSWCQERVQENVNNKILRGMDGPSSYYRYFNGNTYPPVGWRPCLELIG